MDVRHVDYVLPRLLPRSRACRVDTSSRFVLFRRTGRPRSLCPTGEPCRHHRLQIDKRSLVDAYPRNRGHIRWIGVKKPTSIDEYELSIMSVTCISVVSTTRRRLPSHPRRSG